MQCDTMRGLVEECVVVSAASQDLCVSKAKMAPHISQNFSGTKIFEMGDAGVKGEKPYSETLVRYEYAIVEQQQRLLDLQQRIGIPIKDLKELTGK